MGETMLFEEPKYLYHITSEKYVDDIMKVGLIPKLGYNSKLVDEEKPLIYLCNREDLPYWIILTGNTTVLKVDLRGINTENSYHYYKYSEYMIEESIGLDNIKEVFTQEPELEHMKELCLSFLKDISYSCLVIAKYYTAKEKNITICDERRPNGVLRGLLACLNRIDYGVLSEDEIVNYLKDYGGQGEYTFCDEYINTGRKLYEQLIYYPEDEYTKQRKQLNEFITNHFAYCKNLYTGGWTGEV